MIHCFFSYNQLILYNILEKEKKVGDIKTEIKSLKKNMEIIKDGCEHNKFTIKFDSDSKSVRKICKDCEKVIGYPTEQELKDNNFL